MTKRILAFAFAALMLFSSVSASAADSNFGPWEFSSNATHTRVSLADPTVTETGECSYSTTHVPATCLYDGFDVNTCTVCQYTYKFNYVPPIGKHDFTDWMSNFDATFKENGTESRICKVCGEKETRTDEDSAYISLLLGKFDFKLLLNALKSAGGWLVTIVKMIINVVKNVTG